MPALPAGWSNYTTPIIVVVVMLIALAVMSRLVQRLIIKALVTIVLLAVAWFFFLHPWIVAHFGTGTAGVRNAVLTGLAVLLVGYLIADSVFGPSYYPRGGRGRSFVDRDGDGYDDRTGEPY